ncbi:Hypothetical predicted protein, partial [Pelobates cultripes]
QKSSIGSEAERAQIQDGADDQDAGTLHTDKTSHWASGELTKAHLTEALDAMSDKLVKTWQTSIEQLRKEVLDIGNRTAHIENKLSEYATAHNDIADHVAALEQKVTQIEARMADVEDRSRRNNLRLRGVSETALPGDLQAYVRGLMRAYIPEITADMMLVDRVHRVPKPRNLPDTTPRAHYFHIKEAVLRTSRNRATPHEDYPSVKIMADLSAATLKHRKEFQETTQELRNKGIRYRWGYPTKLLITKNNGLKIIHTPEEGLKQLKEWGLLTGSPKKAGPAERLTPEWRQISNKST